MAEDSRVQATLETERNPSISFSLPVIRVSSVSKMEQPAPSCSPGFSFRYVLWTALLLLCLNLQLINSLGQRGCKSQTVCYWHYICKTTNHAS
ncbi:hypothetical protein HanRHA438_Chr04g0166701 [Helianthus annuus]|nr:hypothetical protein HanRHA438_Chr04g0166701 [Helianthus annuus]KAJ0930545.1 hypothetical protein HanPSC8_Chr04g0150561 [Helianthus annuus]